MSTLSNTKGIDKLIYLVVIGGPIMNLPQLLKIWIEKDSSGVSILSWVAFAIGSCIWLIYGIAHKDKPIIFMNSALMVVQIAIAASVVVFS